MSLFKKFGRALKKTVKAVAPIAATGVFGPVGAALGTAVAARGAGRSAQPLRMQVAGAPALGGMAGIGMLPRVLPGIGRALTSPAVKRVARDIGTGVAGAFIFDQFGNIVGQRKRHRRINPLNARAARRAIRRIKAVRKITADIERQLPRRKAPAPAARCPPSRRR